MSKSRILLCVLAGSFLLSGIVETVAEASGQPNLFLPLLHSLTIAVLCLFWCRTDALERGIEPRRSPFWAGLFPLIGIPLYLFRSRPKGKAFLSIGKTILFTFGVTALYFLGSFLVVLVSGRK
jgi:hypothetical protein